MTSYWTAYLKAHYPSAFMAALMTSDYDDIDRLAIEIAECKHMGIKVLPPDANESFHEFAVVPDADNPDNRKAAIRFGMDAIKNVGSGAVDEIIRAREEKGKFETLEDFITTINTRQVNRKALESLVKAGALDCFGDRNTLLHNLETIVAYGQRLAKERASGQTDLFGNVMEDIGAKPTLKLDPPAVKYNPHELLIWERELLGLYLSKHPLDAYSALLAEQTVPLNTIKPEFDTKPVTVGGVVVDMREILTKNGQKMAFVKIEDEFGEIELILFPSVFQQTLGLWERDHIVIARGKVSAKDRNGNIGEEVKILVDDGREVTHAQAAAYQPTGRKQRELKVGKRKGSALKAAVAAAKAERTTSEKSEPAPRPTRVYIRLLKSDDNAMLQSLKMAIDEQKGDSEVVLVLGPDAAKQAIKLPTRMSSEASALERIQSLVGASNVVLQQ